MTAPMSAERRREIETMIARLMQYDGSVFATTACYNGLREEAAGTLSLLVQEIDRLTADRDAAVAAAAMAEREATFVELERAAAEERATATDCGRHGDFGGRDHYSGRASVIHHLVATLRSRPAPAPAAPTADAEMLAALKAALLQAEGCWANHYGDNAEGGAVPEHIQMMRDAIARAEGRTP